MKEGTVHFLIKGPDDDWATNQSEYRLGPFDQGGVGISVFKKADRTLEVRFASEHFGHTFSGPMPPVPANGFSVAVRWTEKEVTLFVNGEKVFTTAFKPLAN